jgi:transposase
MPRPNRTSGAERPRRTFTTEFKVEAVRLLHQRQQAGGTLAAAARELGLTPDRLRAWERQLTAAGAPVGERPPESEAEELRRLRRENVVLRQEREFLKKATAFFARESQ